MGHLTIDPRNTRKVRRAAETRSLTAAEVRYPAGWRPSTCRVLEVEPIGDRGSRLFVACNEYGPLYLVSARTWEDAWEEFVDEYAERCGEDPAEDVGEDGEPLGVFSSGGEYLSDCTVGYMRLEAIDPARVRLIAR